MAAIPDCGRRGPLLRSEADGDGGGDRLARIGECLGTVRADDVAEEVERGQRRPARCERLREGNRAVLADLVVPQVGRGRWPCLPPPPDPGCCRRGRARSSEVSTVLRLMYSAIFWAPAWLRPVLLTLSSVAFISVRCLRCLSSSSLSNVRLLRSRDERYMNSFPVDRCSCSSRPFLPYRGHSGEQHGLWGGCGVAR